MRKILFRGYSTIFKKWYFGSYLYLDKPVHNPNSHDPVSTDPIHYIVTPDGVQHPVDPETVGQFTGFYDSTKWEDLTPEEQQAFLHQPDGWENTPDVWPGKRIFDGDIVDALWSDGIGNDRNNLIFADMSVPVKMLNLDFSHKLKVIGNIHDNPELLNKAENSAIDEPAKTP